MNVPPSSTSDGAPPSADGWGQRPAATTTVLGRCGRKTQSKAWAERRAGTHKSVAVGSLMSDRPGGGVSSTSQDLPPPHLLPSTSRLAFLPTLQQWCRHPRRAVRKILGGHIPCGNCKFGALTKGRLWRGHTRKVATSLRDHRLLPTYSRDRER